jgi:hypothetical protein
VNPLDLFRCFAAVFDPNASPQLLNECNLRGGIFQSYWPVWALLGTALLAAAGLVVRKYLRRPLPTADEASGGYTPPPFDPDRISARADESSELTAQLDRLLEEADAIRQRLEQDRLDDARQEGWTSDAEQFVALNFQHFATDFRIAREPNQRLGGAHQSDIWARLKRIAAQMEVLREIKRGLRARPVSQPSSDAIRAGQEALRAKEEAEGRGRAIRRALERLKAEHEDALSKSPHLTWSGVSVVAYRQGYEVRVECANVGPTRAQVQVGSRVTAVASQPEMTGPQDDSGDEVVTLAAEVREPIEFYEFSVPGVIHPVGPYLPFILRMRCPEASPLLDRTVFWRIVYKDDDDKLGFITDCSAIIDFTLGTFSVGAVVLDQSSREARHEKFKKDVAMPSGDA